MHLPAGDILLYADTHPTSEYRGKPTSVKCGLDLGGDDITCSFRCCHVIQESDEKAGAPEVLRSNQWVESRSVNIGTFRSRSCAKYWKKWGRKTNQVAGQKGLFDMGFNKPRKTCKVPPEDPMVVNTDNATGGEIGEDDGLDSNKPMDIANDNHVE